MCTSVHDCIYVECVYLRFIVLIHLVGGAWPWHMYVHVVGLLGSTVAHIPVTSFC